MSHLAIPRFVRGLLALLLGLLPVLAPAQAGPPYGQQQLQQMLAPIALYPDPLLSQLLMAATYPDEFGEAVAWAKAHPDARGDDAVRQVEPLGWDPSVASLAAVPQVLVTLGERPDDVRRLGDAFLAQPADVMDAVQRLRAAAVAAGTLKSGDRMRVSTTAAPATAGAAPAQVIVVQPAQPSVVYVPVYDPNTVYGTWPYPSAPPAYYPPPPGSAFANAVVSGIGWGIGFSVVNSLWGGFDWGHHDVNINVNRFNNIHVDRRIDLDRPQARWHHDPDHRRSGYAGGDAMRQRLTQQRDVNRREAFRGRDAAPAGPARESARQAAAEHVGRPERAGRADRAERAPAPREPDRETARAALQERQGAAPAAAQLQQVGHHAAASRGADAASDHALRDVGDRHAVEHAERGAASARAAQRHMPAGGAEGHLPAGGGDRAHSLGARHGR